jgi:D-sedoheptulose 7-phosphate isomerase
MTTLGVSSVVQNHFASSVAGTHWFFETNAVQVAECCRRMADRFSRGGTLLVLGEGARSSDAQHVAVEFVHPVIVGKRALPAVALTSDIGVFTAASRCAARDGFAGPLLTLARADDIVLAFCADAVEPAIRAALSAAKAAGLLTILVGGRFLDAERLAAIEFRIEDPNPLVVQEVSETLYHVLWELVHVFFEADDARLLQFLPSAAASTGAELIAEVKESTRQKARDICDVRLEVQRQFGSRIREAGVAMAERVRRAGRVLAFGNGGSATDAQDVAADCMAPPMPGWRHIPALALTNDIGVVTAVGNDVGFERVFSRQVIAFGGQTDVAIGFSTSGASRNVLAAMSEARSRGLLTIAMSGGDGGELARSADVDFCFTAPIDHLPRIQEAHATTWHALLAVVQEALA